MSCPKQRRLSVMEFGELDAALKRAGLVTDAAEMHGTLCGMICSGIDDTWDLWVGMVFDEADPDNPSMATSAGDLRRLYDQTRALFASDGFEIQPLLPDDDEEIRTRTECLASWCQGFLYGLSLSDTPAEQIPEQVKEIIADFAELTRARVNVAGAGAESEINENAYIELMEYVRVSVQLVYEELLGNCEPQELGDRTVH